MSAPRVAVLGTGAMGAGMARSLLREGIEVAVWNRTAERSKPLAADGADVALDAATAVVDADVVVAMLFDAAATLDVMATVLPAMKDGAVFGYAWEKKETGDLAKPGVAAYPHLQIEGNRVI